MVGNICRGRWSPHGGQDGQRVKRVGSQDPLQRHTPSDLTCLHYTPCPEGSTASYSRLLTRHSASETFKIYTIKTILFLCQFCF
jgi:hypothetical protein